MCASLSRVLNCFCFYFSFIVHVVWRALVSVCTEQRVPIPISLVARCVLHFFFLSLHQHTHIHVNIILMRSKYIGDHFIALLRRGLFAYINCFAVRFTIHGSYVPCDVRRPSAALRWNKCAAFGGEHYAHELNWRLDTILISHKSCICSWVLNGSLLSILLLLPHWQWNRERTQLTHTHTARSWNESLRSWINFTFKLICMYLVAKRDIV